MNYETISILCIAAAIVLAALLDWIKWKIDRQRFSKDELRRIFDINDNGKA